MPQIRDVPVNSFSAGKSKIDFDHEQRRLAVLEKILSHHGFDFKANRLGGALRGTCIDGIHCDLDEIDSRISTKSKQIEFKLSGALYNLMDSKGGGSGFADLVSTVLAQTLPLWKPHPTRKAENGMSPYPTNAEQNKKLLVDLKTYAIAKVKQDNGKRKYFRSWPRRRQQAQTTRCARQWD